MGLYLGQVLILDDQSCVENSQLLRILDQIAHFAVLFAQLLHLQVAFKYLRLRSLLLLGIASLEELLSGDPLVEGASQVFELTELLVKAQIGLCFFYCAKVAALS